MARIKVVLHHYKKYKDETSPIMLKVTKGKYMKYFKIGDTRFNIKPNQWNKEFGLIKADKRVNPDHVFLNTFIKRKLGEGIKILERFEESGKPWTLNMFALEYNNKPKITKVKPFIEKRIEQFHNQGRYNTSTMYKEALHIFETFDKKFDQLYFQDIDYQYIENLYVYLKNVRKNKDSTVSIILRTFRAVLNEAINQGVGSKETYPFSKLYGANKVFKISKLEKTKTKRFIPKEYIIKLLNAELIEPHLNWARQIFLFSFFASGLNFKDMAYLKEQNIKIGYTQDNKENKYIELNRRKTNENLTIPITENLNSILDWAKTANTNDNEYLLPIITKKELTGEKLNNHIGQRRKRCNMHLKTIAKRLDFPEGLLNITSYSARHAYATTLLRNGIQVEKISEALGHTNIKTTQTYLASFGLDEMGKINEDLLK